MPLMHSWVKDSPSHLACSNDAVCLQGWTMVVRTGNKDVPSYTMPSLDTYIQAHLCTPTRTTKTLATRTLKPTRTLTLLTPIHTLHYINLGVLPFHEPRLRAGFWAGMGRGVTGIM